MKAIITLAPLLLAFLIQTNAWVSLEKYDPNGAADSTSHCYSSNHNIGALNKGEMKRIEGQCATATCRDDRDVLITGCGVVVVEPPCYIMEGNLSKPFPDCCYELKCLEENNNKI